MTNFIDDEIAEILEKTEYILTADQVLIIKRSLVNAVFAGVMDSTIIKDATVIGQEIGMIKLLDN